MSSGVKLYAHPAVASRIPGLLRAAQLSPFPWALWEALAESRALPWRAPVWGVAPSRRLARRTVASQSAQNWNVT
eukprot:8850268-Pyramimonas_sp.AAC.1